MGKHRPQAAVPVYLAINSGATMSEVRSVEEVKCPECRCGNRLNGMLIHGAMCSKREGALQVKPRTKDSGEARQFNDVRRLNFRSLGFRFQVAPDFIGLWTTGAEPVLSLTPAEARRLRDWLTLTLPQTRKESEV